jgi:hypothetical protein
MGNDEMNTTTKWNERVWDGGGRFQKSLTCDGCNKPIGKREMLTDDEVCDGDDVPGFRLCGRVRCARKLEGMDVEARRAHYTAMRAAR